MYVVSDYSSWATKYHNAPGAQKNKTCAAFYRSDDARIHKRPIRVTQVAS